MRCQEPAATHRQSQGWAPGSRVAILSKNCPWWLLSTLAVGMTSHRSVPLYPTLKAHTVAHILRHSEAKAWGIGNFAWALETGIRRIPINADDRVLSCLPLAHVVERVLVEQGWMRTGMHLYAADSLEAVAADLLRARPTIFFPVPRLWLKFQHGVHHKLPPERLDRLRAIPLIEALGRCWPGTGAAACRSTRATA